MLTLRCVTFPLSCAFDPGTPGSKFWKMHSGRGKSGIKAKSRPLYPYPGNLKTWMTFLMYVGLCGLYRRAIQFGTQSITYKGVPPRRFIQLFIALVYKTVCVVTPDTWCDPENG